MTPLLPRSTSNGNWDREDSSDDDDISEFVTATLKFIERSRIAEAAFCGPSTFAPEKCFHRHVAFCNDMIDSVNGGNDGVGALGGSRSRCQPSPGMTEAQVILPNPEPEEKRNVPLKCEGFQCLFRLPNGGL